MSSGSKHKADGPLDVEPSPAKKPKTAKEFQERVERLSSVINTANTEDQDAPPNALNEEHPVIVAAVKLKKANTEAANIREAKVLDEQRVKDHLRDGYRVLAPHRYEDGWIDTTYPGPHNGLNQQLDHTQQALRLFRSRMHGQLQDMKTLRESGFGAALVAQNQAVRFHKDHPHLLTQLAKELMELAKQLEANLVYTEKAQVKEYAPSYTEVAAKAAADSKAERDKKTEAVTFEYDSESGRTTAITVNFAPDTTLSEIVDDIVEKDRLDNLYVGWFATSRKDPNRVVIKHQRELETLTMRDLRDRLGLAEDHDQWIRIDRIEPHHALCDV